MAFNTGLSGLRAASVDLDVTGNNIANASTVGFKSSRVQFGDLYASGFLSAGTNPIGDGVRVLVEERVQKAHWLLARVEPSLVEQGHHRCEGRRVGGGAAL